MASSTAHLKAPRATTSASCSRCRPRAALAAASAARQALAPPATISEAPVRVQGPASILAAAAVLAAAAAAVAHSRRQASAAAAPEYPGMAGLVRPAKSESAAQPDPEFRLALARSRQATAVLRALGFLRAGSRSRAWVEVRRALHQYSICGEPLLGSPHSRDELAALYRLLLEETADVPPDSSLLLRLRALLVLEFEYAEELEREVAAALAQQRQREAGEAALQSTVVPLPPAKVASSPALASRT